MLEKLQEEQTWKAFREYKLTHGHLSKGELKDLDSFIEGCEYADVAKRILSKNFEFPRPERREINKSGSTKKRVIYTFGRTETYVLKCLTWLLYRYDERISSACYSFRPGSTAKTAINEIFRINRSGCRYVYKADIHNYFNSIPSDRLADEITKVIDDDEPLCRFLQRLVLKNEAVSDGRIVYENRGGMAGIPVSAFFANIYLKSLDELFTKRGVHYFRYSDDILIIGDTEEEITEYRRLLTEHISDRGLELNSEKECLTGPGEPFEFLGFKFGTDGIDLSDVTVMKMKAKIKRKAHALYRWRISKNVTYEQTAGTMIKIFNRKYFDDSDEHDFSWSRWFFPVLTTDRGLHELDEYMVMYLRYLYSGRHYKGNYRVTYEQLKKLGFRSLVHEFYGKETR